MKTQSRHSRRIRKNAGAMLVTILGFGISVLILLTLGVISFEAIRGYTARDELRSATESAALAAAAALASSGTSDSAAAHLAAINAAHEAFNSNSIIGQPLAIALTATTDNHVPPLSEASLFIQFLNPKNNNQPTSPPDYINGMNIRCVGAYSLAPAFAVINYAYPIRAEATGRTPQLDLVICFDCSGSIDDQTKVTFVRRVWDDSAQPIRPGPPGRIQYEIVSAPAGSWQLSNVSNRAAGKLLDIVSPFPVGSGVQATWPEGLRSSSDPRNSQTPLTFNMLLRNGGGASDSGNPPGNFPPAAVPTGSWAATDYTDLVTNLDERDDFAGGTFNGYSFPDVATLVEAARGNLENQGVFASSHANTSVPASVAPRPGYQAAYLAAARNVCQPIGAARQAALRFYQLMKNNTDAHFAFVAFSSNVHTTPTDTRFGWNIDSRYPAGGSSDFPMPGVALDANNSNFTEICGPNGVLMKTLATGGTNIGGALDKGVDILTSNATRPDAKRAIVLFTDGQWNTGPNPTIAATRAKNSNKDIAIYTIGLAQNREIIPLEVDTLNDGGAGTTYDYLDPRTGAPGQYTATADGVAKIAGNGGKFFLVTNSRNLNFVFANIARSLVQLMQQ